MSSCDEDAGPSNYRTERPRPARPLRKSAEARTSGGRASQPLPRRQSPRPSEPRRGQRSSAPARTTRDNREPTCRTVKNVVPPIPLKDIQELDPDDINEHFEQSLDFNTYKTASFQEQQNSAGQIRSHGIEGKFFRVRQRKLVASRTKGYYIEIRYVSEDGTFYCVFDDADAKACQIALRKELKKFYDHELPSYTGMNMINLKVGELVVAKVDDPHSSSDKNVFIRAKVLNINKITRTAVIRNLDDYDDHEVKLHCLYKIVRLFVEQEAHMFTARLEFLEFFSGTNIVQRVLEECPLVTPMCYVMYFTGEYTKDGKTPLVEITKLDNSNKHNIGKYILTNLVAALSPLNSLMEDKRRCKIIKCTNNGMVWLRFSSDDWFWDRVYSALQNLSEKYQIFCKLNPLNGVMIKRTKACENNMVFITNFCVEESGRNEIRRVKVIENLWKENHVKVELMDYGSSHIVCTSDIYPLEIFDQALCFVPKMVVKVHLESIKFMKASIEDIQSFIGDSVPTAKVVDEWPGGIICPDVRIIIEANQPGNNDDDDYKQEDEYTSKSLSTWLLNNGLAIQLNKDDCKKISKAKALASRDYAKRMKEYTDW